MKYKFCKLEVVWIHSITEDNNQSDDHLSIDRMMFERQHVGKTCCSQSSPVLARTQRRLQIQSDRSSSENLLKNKPVVWWIHIVSRLILGSLSSKTNTWNVIFARLIMNHIWLKSVLVRFLQTCLSLALWTMKLDVMASPASPPTWQSKWWNLVESLMWWLVVLSACSLKDLRWERMWCVCSLNRVTFALCFCGWCWRTCCHLRPPSTSLSPWLCQSLSL